MDIEARYLSEPGRAGVFTRLARLGLLVDAFQHRCLDEFDLRFVDYSVLRLLQLAGPPHRMSPTELSEAVLRSSGGMTQILDRLQAVGLVERIADPGDRRRVLAALTADGLARARTAHRRYARERERLLGALSDDELHELDTAIHRLLGILGDDADSAVEAPGRPTPLRAS